MANEDAVPGFESWTTGSVHVAAGDPGGYWPDVPCPQGEEPGRLSRFVGGFDGNR